MEFCILESIYSKFSKILEWEKIDIKFKLKCKILLYWILNCLDIQGFGIKKILMNSNSIEYYILEFDIWDFERFWNRKSRNEF